MLERVVSGGQTGSDQAGWRAAKLCGIATGGRMPKGWLTEDGPCPEFAELYGAVEMTTSSYPHRTRANIRDSDGTLWFGNPESPGGRTTLGECERLGMPEFIVIDGMAKPSDVAAWIEAEEIRTLNVAGNRESSSPGIGARVEVFMVAVFRRLQTT
jgi:hypothetical protein